MNNDVYLTGADYKNIINNKIGEGSDAKVYRASKDILYKIYHSSFIGVEEDILNEETKVVKSIKDVSIKNKAMQPLDYVDEHGVRISRQDAINKAIEKQKNVLLTNLPIGNLYVNNSFCGCVLKAQNYAFQIHSIKILPKKLRLKILKELLIKVDELLENNIYPVDLANKPMGNKTHSNILVSLKLHPEIIDVDGKSTIYRETDDEYYYGKTMLNLKILLLELLYDIDLNGNMGFEDFDYLEYTYQDELMASLLLKELKQEDTNIKTLEKILGA